MFWEATKQKRLLSKKCSLRIMIMFTIQHALIHSQLDAFYEIHDFGFIVNVFEEVPATKYFIKKSCVL